MEVLQLDLATEDPVFLELDKINKREIEELKNVKILYTDGSRALLALGTSLPLKYTKERLELTEPTAIFMMAQLTVVTMLLSISKAILPL